METTNNKKGSKIKKPVSASRPALPKKKVEIFRDMEVGDSCLMKDEKDRNSSINIARNLIPHMKFRTRQMDDKTIRLFRTA